MKIKLLSAALAVCVTAGCIYLKNQTGSTAGYTPRGSALAEGSYLEMLPYMEKLRGNLESGNIESADWVAMRNAVLENDRAHMDERDVDLAWFEMGPNNVGGRTRAILCVDNYIIFAGSVSGGLWKSVNGGNSWSEVTTFPGYSVSAIEMTGDGTIYVGTGSSFESGTGGNGSSGFAGTGLYSSSNMGVDWAIVPGTEVGAFTTSESWGLVNDLAADPNQSDRIWIAGSATVGYYHPGLSEPEMDMDGLPNQIGQDLEWAVDGSYLLVAIGAARVYRSNDGGNSFTQLEEGIPGSSGRARLAISPDDTNTAYVLYATGGGSMGGLFLTTNKGDNWSEIWPGGNDIPEELDPTATGVSNQGYYDLALIVKPGDPCTAFVGGVTLWKAGCATSPELIASNQGFGGLDFYVHSDIHTFEMAPNGNWYIGGDGGVFMSNDGGSSYTAMNFGYNVTQYYGIAHTAGYAAMGGSQDNGTTIMPGLGNPFVDVPHQQTGLEINGGDGFDCDVSQVTVGSAIALFVSSQNGHIGRIDQNGTGGSIYDEDIISLLDPITGDIGPFYTVMRLYEDTEDENSQQYIRYENPYDEDISDSTLTLFTLNQNLPFEWDMPNDLTLHYWEELIRPEFTTNELITVDPNYFWFDTPEELQDTAYSYVDCDSLEVVEIVLDSLAITQWVYWQDTIFYELDTIIVVDSTEVLLDYEYFETEVITFEADEETCQTYYVYASDTLNEVHEQIQILDTYTSMYVTAFSGSQGLWLTRQGLNLNVVPDWWRLGNAPSSGVKAFEYTKDGNTLFYSSWGGELMRITGLQDLWSVNDVANLEMTTIISNAGATITGIASDPNNPNKLAITLGGYGTAGDGKVQYCTNALAADVSAGDFEDIWYPSGDLARMPCYDVVINVADNSGETIVVGTEFGVWATDNLGDTWTHVTTQSVGSTGTIWQVPVFALRQQQTPPMRFINPENYGRIYAGTHGRGMFLTDEWTSVPELSDEKESQSQMLVFPNPTAGDAFLSLDMTNSGAALIKIFDVRGTLVSTITKSNLAPGNHRISLNAQQLSKGTYLIHVDAGTSSGIARLVKVE